MLFPLQPYTRDRTSTEKYGAPMSYSYTNTQWAGTPSDPWKVTGTTNYGASFDNWWVHEMHDVESPNWKELWRHGIATVNPMEHCSVFYFRNTGNYLMKRVNRSSTQPYYYTGHQNSGTNVIGDSYASNSWNYPSQPSIDDSIIAEAIQEAWSKVSLQDTMALATAAELSKTLDFLLSTMRKVWKIYRSVRKLDVLGVAASVSNLTKKQISSITKTSVKEVANAYMEARYALRPLMYDIRNTMEAVADKVPAKYTTFRAYKADIAEVTDSNFLLREVTGDYRMTGTSVANRSLEVRAGVLTMVEAFNAFARWGCGDILQTAWELVPFSFIVDWFFQVGKLISSWAPKIGLRTLASWYVVDDMTTLSVTAVTGTSLASGYNYINIYNRSGTYSKVIRNRYRLPNPDRPILPSCNIRLNNLKLLDLSIIGTAIATSWFGRKTVKSRPKTNYGYAWFDD